MIRRLALVVVALAAVGGAYLWSTAHAGTRPIVGMVRQTEIRIAPEIGGRLARVLVEPGQHVAKGDLLATIDNPDLVAALGETGAALASAVADHDRVLAGVRREERAIAAEAVSTAESNLTLAQQQNRRVSALAGHGFNSQSQLDESNATMIKATADFVLRRAQLAAAYAGPTAEERALAEAKVQSARAAIAKARTRLAKTRLLAPEAGIVVTRIAQDGEVLTPGKPVLTLAPDHGIWFSFTAREDALHGLGVGSKTALRIGQTAIAATVTELLPLGEFATWRAARAVGDHDLNSFRIRLDPAAAATAVEPGMTALLSIPQ